MTETVLPKTLFNEIDFTKIKTEGIKYVGSKHKIIPYILKMVSKLNVKTVFDGFSGTTRVSQAFAKLGYRVIANDLAIWSKVFATTYLLNERDRRYYLPMIEHLNSLPGKYGWFSEHYGGDPRNPNAKKPWQIHNTKKLDAIREEIEVIAKDDIEKSVLLTSLILALDKVDNTVGHYASYLKGWAKRSYNSLKLEVPMLIPKTQEHEVYQDDIFNLLPNIEVDLAYYDPPYGSNNDKMPPSRVRYQAYYHIWTTIIKNDKPELFGTTNRRKDTSDKINYSPFEDFRKNPNGRFVASDAIERLIRMTNAKYIIFSYSSGGRVPISELIRIFSNDDTRILEFQEIDYKKNVMTYMRWTNEWVNDRKESHKEYLFLLEKKSFK